MPFAAHQCPARIDGLETRDAADGFVVYDARRDRLHFLNPTALFVLECLDGRTRVDELAGLVARAFRLPEAPIAEIEACLERFDSEGLIEAGATGQTG
ncbi:MAG: PqqD family protein [Burkholderiales bacterium]